MEQCAVTNCKALIEELTKISAASSQYKDLNQRCKELEERAKLLLEHIIGLHCTVIEHQNQIDALKREVEQAKRELEQAKREHEQAKRELEQPNVDNKQLYLAQAGFVFQQNICAFVLDKRMAEARECTLKDLDSPGKEVEKRWEAICAILKWKPCWNTRYDAPMDISAIMFVEMLPILTILTWMLHEVIGQS